MPGLLRADHVGSLVPPRKLVDARAHLSPEHDEQAEELRLALRAAVAETVRHQRDAGLVALTDGDFAEPAGLPGFASALAGIDLAGEEGAPRLVDRPGFPADHPMLSRLSLLREQAGNAAKLALPAPLRLASRLMQGGLHDGRSRTLDDVLDALAPVYAEAGAALGRAGLQRLQFDDALPDGVELHPERIARQGDILRQAIAGLGEAATIGLFLPRPAPLDALEALFDQSGPQMLLAGFEPDADMLSLLPSGCRLMLGLISVQAPDLEPLDLLRRGIDRAGESCDPERLGLAPSAGFGGGQLTVDQQRRKLDRLVQAADRIWGTIEG